MPAKKPIRAGQLFRMIGSGKISPIYLFYGPEKHIAVEAVARIRKVIIGPGMEGFNVDTFQADEVDAGHLLDTMLTLPVCSPSRLVVVRGIEALREGTQKALLTYLDKPSPSTCLVLTADKIDRRRRFYKQIESAGTIVACYALDGADLRHWIQDHFRMRGKAISVEATAELIDLVGADLQKLDSEIEKISLFAGERARIEGSDVREVASDVRLESIFRMVDHIQARRAGDALRALRPLLEQGEEPVKILYLIAGQYRDLCLVKEMSALGRRDDELARALGSKGFKARFLASLAGRYSSSALEESLHKIRGADLALKSMRTSRALLLERLVLELCAV